MPIINQRADIERLKLLNLPFFLEIAITGASCFCSRWPTMEVNQFDIEIVKEALQILLKPYWVNEVRSLESSDGELAWNSAIILDTFFEFMEEYDIPRDTFYD